MRPLTARQVEEILSANGYEFRRMKGSHAIWYSPVRRHAVPVPRHGSSTLPEGTLQAIFRGTGIPKPPR